MNEIDEMCAEVFLKDQGRLFDEPVAETVDEAMGFLADCFAQVFNSEKELKHSHSVILTLRLSQYLILICDNGICAYNQHILSVPIVPTLIIR